MQGCRARGGASVCSQEASLGNLTTIGPFSCFLLLEGSGPMNRTPLNGETALSIQRRRQRWQLLQHKSSSQSVRRSARVCPRKRTRHRIRPTKAPRGCSVLPISNTRIGRLRTIALRHASPIRRRAPGFLLKLRRGSPDMGLERQSRSAAGSRIDARIRNATC